jgi:hypothetical protein
MKTATAKAKLTRKLTPREAAHSAETVDGAVHWRLCWRNETFCKGPVAAGV